MVQYRKELRIILTDIKLVQDLNRIATEINEAIKNVLKLVDKKLKPKGIKNAQILDICKKIRDQNQYGLILFFNPSLLECR